MQLYGSIQVTGGITGTYVWNSGIASAPTLLGNWSSPYYTIIGSSLYSEGNPTKRTLAGASPENLINSWQLADGFAAVASPASFYIADAAKTVIAKVTVDYSYPMGAYETTVSTTLAVKALVVHPTTGIMYAGLADTVVTINMATGVVASTVASSLAGGTVRSLAFSAAGDLYVATNTAVLKLTGASGTPATIASGYAAPVRGKTLAQALSSVAVDASGNVYFAVVGYDNTYGTHIAPYIPSVDGKIYKLTGGTGTPSLVSNVPVSAAVEGGTDLDNGSYWCAPQRDAASVFTGGPRVHSHALPMQDWYHPHYKRQRPYRELLGWEHVRRRGQVYKRGGFAHRPECCIPVLYPRAVCQLRAGECWCVCRDAWDACRSAYGCPPWPTSSILVVLTL